MGDKTAPELARETLKQLIVRKLAPTPANYQAVFNEIGGLPNEPPFPVEQLRKIAQELPAKTPGQQKQRSLMEYAVSQLSWEGVHKALVAYGGFSPRTGSETSGFGLLTGNESPAPVNGRGTGVAVSAGAPALTADFLEQIARMIEFARPALGTDDARFSEQTQEMLRIMRQPGADIVQVKQMLSTFGHRVSFAAEDQAEIKSTLLHLLRLIMENIGELSLDDRWLKGQVDALMIAATPPLTLRRLDDVERRLRDVMFKQSEAKGRAVEAQEEMRKMLGTFIERLSIMTDSTSAYSGKMEAHAKVIEMAKSFEELTPVLKEVVSATRGMAADSLSARNELRGMREHAQTTEAEIMKLHLELDRVSAQARHDPLTGALNRKGLDEALNREVSNVRRKETPLCMALLDIDNFKRINDDLGHITGDQALAHLAQVARESMRPQDTLARYGGEEFVILLPDTTLDKGIEAMTRLQRELTKRFFLAGVQKLLITFSAGVAQLSPGEEGAAAIKRADQAMYMAKRAGKNRVLGA
ncbi:MAG: diguanylate cyclase [Rhodoferax sp.]|nr:diguanylate cyclase [Rhodoferax sp.]